MLRSLTKLLAQIRRMREAQYGVLDGRSIRRRDEYAIDTVYDVVGHTTGLRGNDRHTGGEGFKNYGRLTFHQ